MVQNTSLFVERITDDIAAPQAGGWNSGLHGTHVFIDAQASLSTSRSSLHRNAYLIALRQEVYMTFIHQHEFRLPLDPVICSNYRSLEPTEDHVWAHRAIIHCADVLTFCYGKYRGNNDEYDSLAEYHDGWARLRPRSFDPIFEKFADIEAGELYPHMWYLSDCHGSRALAMHQNPANVAFHSYGHAALRSGKNPVSGLRSKST